MTLNIINSDIISLFYTQHKTYDWFERLITWWTIYVTYKRNTVTV